MPDWIRSSTVRALRYAKYTRISKVGNRRLRCALYMPALVAVARKLLLAIYGMFRTGRSFDGARIYTLPVLALSEKSA
jgi:hypothetical protein